MKQFLKNDSEVVFMTCPSSNNLNSKVKIQEEIADTERKLKVMRREMLIRDDNNTMGVET